MTYSSIVVGTDGSQSAGRAVGEAAALAAADGARLVVVTAYREGEGPVRDVEQEELPEDIRHVLTDRVQAEELAASGRQAAKDAGVTKVVVQAVAGDPGGVLLETARDFDADLIVVGSRGLSSHAHLLLGSVAGSVVHHAPCDVLVAHTAP
jgi:nucleotide-binding universal stress UspA family protein